MKSLFNISRGILDKYSEKSVSLQVLKLKNFLDIELKASKKGEKIDLLSHKKFSQEQRFSFKSQAILIKSVNINCFQNKLALGYRSRFVKHRFFLTSKLYSRFSTEINKVSKICQRTLITGGNFIKVFDKNTIFVDKSLFIKQIIEDTPEVILITMPRRWGKSLNIDMLKRFLSIEQQDLRNKQQNKEIFTQMIKQSQNGPTLLNISKSEIKLKKKGIIVNALQLQGKYPVIFLNLKDCIGSTLQEIKSKLNKVIVDTVEQFGYLAYSKKVYRGHNTIGQKYDGLLSQTNSGTYQTAIKDLSKLLYHYHQKNVWILVDEYDAAANKAYLQLKDSDPLAVSEIFRKVLQPALKDNDYLQKGVITGVQYILKSGVLTGLNNIKKHNFASTKYSKYYGIDQKEMDQLLQLSEIRDQKTRFLIKKWYNGYKQNRGSIDEPNFIDKYNIWSVANYLSDQKGGFQSYWQDNTSLSTVLNNDILKHTKIKQKVEDLINYRKIQINPFVADFEVNDFKVLKSILSNSSQIELQQNGVNLFFSYLVIGGYLTQTAQKNKYAIPNKEIKTQFVKKLKKFYEKLFIISIQKLKSVTQQLKKIFQEENQEILSNILHKGFAPKFQAMIQNLKIYHQNNDKETIFGFYGNEDLWHSLLNFIAMQIPNVKFATQRYTTINMKNEKKKGRADICLSKNDKSVIIEVKYKNEEEKSKQLPISLMSEALKQAKSYINLTQKTHKKIFVGCVITSHKKVLLSHHIILPNNGNTPSYCQRLQD